MQSECKYNIEALSGFDTIECCLLSQTIYQFLKMLNFEYPGFKKWYFNLFSSDGILKDDREILFCRNSGSIIAVSILKNSETEKKICTFRVKKNFQGQGIGHQLMEKSFEYLDTEKPLITLHKNKENEFLRLLRYYNFQKVQSLKGYYRCFSTELCYNGALPDKGILLVKSFDINGIKRSLEQFLRYNINRFDNFDMLLESFVATYLKENNVKENYNFV